MLRFCILMFFLLIASPAQADVINDLKEADAFFSEFEYGDAIITYNLVLQAQPSIATRLKLADAAYFGALATKHDLRNERLQLAKITLETAKQEKPDDAAILGRLARVLAQLADQSTGRTRIELFEQARDQALQATSLKARDPIANLALGWWNFETARLDRLAKMVYRRVTNGEPTATLADAKHALQIAVTEDAACVSCHLLLGKIELALKHTETARHEWELARTLPLQQSSDEDVRAEARALLQKLPSIEPTKIPPQPSATPKL